MASLSKRFDHLIHETYEVSLFIKGADGILEIIGAALLWTVSPDLVNRLVHTLTLHELSQDPQDFIATHILGTAQHFNEARIFGVLYLLLHGIIKVAMVAALLKRQLWAYPASMAILSVFILYQVYRVGLNHSVLMALLSVFDAFMIWLVWEEYQNIKARAPV